jgi:sec-independent protein translocase protein TatC
MPISTKPKLERRNSSGDPEEFRMSLGGHIDEIRFRLIRSVLAIAVAWVAGWFLEPPIYNSINDLAMKAVVEFMKTNPSFDYKEVFNNFTGPFMLQFKFSFIIGLGLALPYIVLQIWGFVSPGLKHSERKPIQALAPVSVILFFLGAAICWAVLPLTIQWFLTFFASFTNTALYQEPGTMVMFLFKMMLAFGVGFQLPLLVYIAGRVGIIGSDTLTHYWRHATVFVFFTSAILTPSNDPITMLMMAVPLTLLLMLSIFAVRFTMRNKPGAWPEELNALD